MWEGKLPKTKQEAETFMMKNNISGAERNINLNLDWNLMQSDFNLTAPGQGKIT